MARGTSRRDWGSTIAVPAPARYPAWRSRAEESSSLDKESDRLARLETVLFLAREPLTSRKLTQLANLADGTQARSLVRRLRKRYEERGSAFQVEEVAGGFQLFARRKFAPWLRRLEGTPGETRLSGPAMETLAVIAYRQPVLRAEIEAIRGVQCGEILRQLMDRDLVRIAGKSEELGRPFLYGTTKRFLQLFGLRQLEELPRAEALKGGEFGASRLESREVGQVSISTQTGDRAAAKKNGPLP